MKLQDFDYEKSLVISNITKMMDIIGYSYTITGLEKNTIDELRIAQEDLIPEYNKAIKQ